MGTLNVQPGDLDRRVDIQTLTTSQGATGERIKTWAGTAGSTVWARVRDMRGREDLDATKVTHQQVVEFTIRYSSTVTEQNRVVWRGDNFDVQQVIPMGMRDEWLVLTATRTT